MSKSLEINPQPRRLSRFSIDFKSYFIYYFVLEQPLTLMQQSVILIHCNKLYNMILWSITTTVQIVIASLMAIPIPCITTALSIAKWYGCINKTCLTRYHFIVGFNNVSAPNLPAKAEWVASYPIQFLFPSFPDHYYYYWIHKHHKHTIMGYNSYLS